MKENRYCFPHDTTKDYYVRLFSKYEDNSIYKFTAQHVYRFPEGRDILGDELVMFYTIINCPAITLDSNEDQFTTAIITLSGTVRHEDKKEVTVSAAIDGKISQPS